MKKKFISIAKKAMVWTMAASMLVATPLTASAKGLSDIYKIEDQWGKEVMGPDGEHSGDPSRTGTVTSTKPLTDNDIDADIVGIAIDHQDIDARWGDEEIKDDIKLEVKIVNTNGDFVPATEELQGRFTWKSSNTSVAAFKSMNDRPESERGKTNIMYLRIKGGGRATITVTLGDYVDMLNIYIRQDATKIWFDEDWLKADAIEGTSLTLADYVRTEPADATDEFAFSIAGPSKKNIATLKNGVLKLNAKTKGETVDILVVGTNVRSKVTTITIAELIKATGGTFKINGNSSNGKNNLYSWVINKDGRKGVKCEVVLQPGGCNERILSWTSSKTDIVEIETIPRKETDDPVNDKGRRVKLTANATDKKTVITAVTASGKAIKLQLTVDAELTGITLNPLPTPEKYPNTVFSGQTLQLDATQHFDGPNGAKNDNFKDVGLTWSLTNKADVQKSASLNAKTGVLTVQPEVEKNKTLNIEVTGAGQKAKLNDVALQQITIKRIIVSQNAQSTINDSDNTAVIAKATPGGSKLSVKQHNKKKNPVNIKVGGTKTFGLYAEAEEIEGNAAFALGWSVNNAKLARVTKTASTGKITGIKKGAPTVKVTASQKIGDKWKAVTINLKPDITVPSKTLKISTNGTAIADKNQTLTFKLVVDKGSTTKAADIEWTYALVGDTKSTKSFTTPGKLQIEQGEFTGKTLLIKAKIKETGVSTSMRMKVVEPSTSITVRERSKEGYKEGNMKYMDATPSTYKDNYPEGGLVLIPIVNGNEPDPEHKPGIAAVTYTMSTGGVVRVVYNSDGTATVIPIVNVTENTKVVLVPVTADGKKGKGVTVRVLNAGLGPVDTAPYSIE